jgi:IS5 family transposase
MSICQEGLRAKAKTISITLRVHDSDPLIKLCNALDFNHLAEIILPDVQKTKKGLWWLGRKLYLRIHLGVLILQSLLKRSDRELERSILQTPVHQVFCGYGLFVKWKCPDHTKIEEFRNRLQPQTHKKVGDYVLHVARDLGFADPTWVDIDSTVQEANIAYPSDASLMQKLATKAEKVLNFMQGTLKGLVPSQLCIDMSSIKKMAKEYFFLSKNTNIEKKRSVFHAYHKQVESQVLPIISFLETLNPEKLLSIPWNIHRALKTLQNHGRQYLKDVAYFIEHHKMWPSKRLSFHAEAIACIRKGKTGKENEFGRVFQLGRIGGNFMVAYLCLNVRMEDKLTLETTVKEHGVIFGPQVLKSVGTDKGYYSQHNIKSISGLGINTHGIQRPANTKKQPYGEEVRQLRNRRAGIEPLIGHVKEFGLRKSKMKSDEATLSSGYRSVMGFNLHQLKRYLTADVPPKTGA